MDYIDKNTKSNLEVLLEKLKYNVNKETFFDIILEAIDDLKKTEYDNGEVRDFFYNLVFETVFSMNEDYSYVSEYIAYFKSNVRFYLERFEIVVNNIKKGTIHFDNAGETSVLDEEFWEANKVAFLAESAQIEYVTAGFAIQEHEEIASDDTMVLNESFWSKSQQLYSGAEQVNHQPYLIRESSKERIEINRQVYKIGKDKNLVDYIIEANSVISRRHAEIITKGNRYFICDKCSTNKTYVDDKEIPVEEVIEIFNETRFKLANEEFTFYI